jgi:excisionase family DNA binding protein
VLDYTPYHSSLPPVSMQAAIDQTLELLAAESRRVEAQLGIVRLPLPTLEQLRAGPLGRDLARLALVADGHLREPQAEVATVIDAVVQLLFWPAGAEEYTVPRTFWATDLGRMLARAKFRAFGAADLVGINAAAEQLGVSRPTIYRWMDDRSLDYVHDEISGRTFLVRHGIDLRCQVAAELMA